MSTKMRRFSRREEELVDGMIQSISRNISLAESYGDEARDIGWSVFLSVYGKYPAWFLWTGAAAGQGPTWRSRRNCLPSKRG